MRVALLALAAVGMAVAQVEAPSIITKQMREGRRVIEGAIAALGGEKFLALENRVERGRMFSFYHQRLSGLANATIYTRYLPAPEKPDPEKLYLEERQSFGKKKEKWAVLFTEKGGFEITFRGVRPLDDETVKRFRDRRRRDIIYILLRRRNEEGIVFERMGREVVDNYPMIRVDITDNRGEVMTAYFHEASLLPARIVYRWRDKHRIPHEDVIIYDKFRDVGGGVKLPYVQQRLRDEERSFEMFAKEVRINQPLGAELFQLPADAKMLEPVD